MTAFGFVSGSRSAQLLPESPANCPLHRLCTSAIVSTCFERVSGMRLRRCNAACLHLDRHARMRCCTHTHTARPNISHSHQLASSCVMPHCLHLTSITCAFLPDPDAVYITDAAILQASQINPPHLLHAGAAGATHSPMPDPHCSSTCSRPRHMPTPTPTAPTQPAATPGCCPTTCASVPS